MVEKGFSVFLIVNLKVLIKEGFKKYFYKYLKQV